MNPAGLSIRTTSRSTSSAAAAERAVADNAFIRSTGLALAPTCSRVSASPHRTPSPPALICTFESHLPVRDVDSGQFHADLVSRREFRAVHARGDYRIAELDPRAAVVDIRDDGAEDGALFALEGHGLRKVEHGAVDVPRFVLGASHHRGQLREYCIELAWNRLAVCDADGRVDDVAVGEAAERRGGVGIGRSHRRVPGDDVRLVRRIGRSRPGAPDGRLERGVLRIGSVQAAVELLECFVLWPGET